MGGGGGGGGIGVFMAYSGSSWFTHSFLSHKLMSFDLMTCQRKCNDHKL